MATRPTAIQRNALERLEIALDTGAGQDLETSLQPLWNLDSDSKLMPEFRAILIRLLEAPWHQRHEDVAREIQTLRIPEAVPALERTATMVYDYLKYYDDGHAFSRKCIWALADIGSPEAYEALQRLSISAEPVVAGYALKRIARWQDEFSRKLSKSTSPKPTN
jgi:hypothetical protein